MNELLGHQEIEPINGVTPVLVSGLPGNMATLTAEALSRDDRFYLLPFAISSARQRSTSKTLSGGQRIDLLNYYPFEVPKGTIAVDYTTSQSAELNAINYTRRGIPFVMGTTVRNFEVFREMVRHSDISAVIAPNMATPVVELQDALANLLKTSPNYFANWHMTIWESHQDSKVDLDGNPIVSGTAIALREAFERLGAVMDDEIDSIRNRDQQRQLGIQNLDAHAYHCVKLVGPNGEKRQFTTHIEGREPYVDLTLESIPFLARKIKEGARGEIYTAIDVIKERMEPIA